MRWRSEDATRLEPQGLLGPLLKSTWHCKKEDHRNVWQLNMAGKSPIEDLPHGNPPWLGIIHGQRLCWPFRLRLGPPFAPKCRLEEFGAGLPSGVGDRLTGGIPVSRFLQMDRRYHAYTDGGSVMDPEHRDTRGRYGKSREEMYHGWGCRRCRDINSIFIGNGLGGDDWDGDGSIPWIDEFDWKFWHFSNINCNQRHLFTPTCNRNYDYTNHSEERKRRNIIFSTHLRFTL